MTRVVLVPGVLALLPEYAGIEDPVAELRSACLEAVRWLGDSVVVVADAQGERVGEALLSAAGVPTGSAGVGAGASYLVVGNGSACRSDKAPGHLDERAAAYDDALGEALVGCDRDGLAGLDQDLARELWASTAALQRLVELLVPGTTASVDYDDDPFGVQYWVIRWES